METNNDKLATALLTQIYTDYQKEKRYKKLTKFFYVLIFFFVLYTAITSSSQWGKLKDPAPVLYDENFIPVIEIFGGIGSEELNYRNMNMLIEEAFSIEESPGIILHIDSPGGHPYDCYEVTKKIQFLKEKYPEKKVIAQIGSICASGGYYIASVADKIYTTPASVVGSIGVRMEYIQFNRFLEGMDIIPHIFQAGKDKAALHPLKELTPEGKKDIETMLAQHHDIFIKTVQSGRGKKIENSSIDLFTGKVWLGQDSVSLGLTDQIGTFDEMMLEEFGENAQAYIIEEDLGLDLKKLLLQKPKIQIEGLNLNGKSLFTWN